MRDAFHNIIYYIKVNDKRFRNEFILYAAYSALYRAIPCCRRIMLGRTGNMVDLFLIRVI